MNRITLLCFAAAFVLAFGARVHSQSAAAPNNALQQLEAIKAANAALLEKQTGLLLKLDELHKQAEQTKFMVKRG